MQSLKAPIYVYYEIDNFYSNQRDFVKSRSYFQLRGYDIFSNNTDCSGAQLVEEVFYYNESNYKTFTGNKLEGKDTANPCGLVSKAYFNDTFKFVNRDNVTIDINDTDIAHQFDKDYMFKRNIDYDTKQWLDVENGKI